MEELDEFGIPIRKPAQEVDEFGIPVKKKVQSAPDSTGGLKTSLTGSPIFPSVDTKTPSVLTPKGKAEYQEQVASFKPPVPPKEGEPKKPKPDGGAGAAFMAGLNTFNKGLFKTPRLLYDAASTVTDAALQALNLQQDETNYDDIAAASGYNSPLSVLDRLGDHYAGKANQYAQRQEKFNQGIVDSFISGEYKAGGKQLFNNIAESIPSMVGMALTGGAGNVAKLGYLQKTVANALPFISQKNAELTEDESVPKPVRIVNATLNGLSEVIFDQSFGTQAMIQNVVDVFQKQGRDAAVKVAKDFTKGFAEDAIKKIQPVTGVVKGTLEEMATQLSQNIVDRYTVDPEKDLTEGLLDAGLAGGVMTGGIGAIGSVAYSSSQKKKVSDLMKQREELVVDLDNENLPEEVKSDLSNKLSKVDNQISKIDDDNETVVARLSAEDKTILQEKEAKINAIEESLQDGTLSETAKNTLADTLLKEQEAVDTILTKEPVVAEALAKAETDLETLKQVTDKVRKYDASLKRLTDAKNAGTITENEFNDMKSRFDDVMGAAAPTISGAETLNVEIDNERLAGSEQEITTPSLEGESVSNINLNPQENAIQEQISDQIFVQPETAVSAEVAEGVPGAGLEVVTDQSETIPQGEGEITREQTPAKKVIFIKKFFPDKESENLTERQIGSVEKAIDAGIKAGKTGDEIYGILNALGFAPANLAGLEENLREYLNNRVDGTDNRTFQETQSPTTSSPLSQAFDLIESAKRTKKTEKGKMEAGELAITNLGDVGKKAIFIDNNFKDIVSRIRTLKDQKGEPFVKIDCS